MWHGRTIQQAAALLDYDEGQVMKAAQRDIDIRQLLLDTSMLANARERILDGTD